ncbi:MAG TPA: isocitrate lyase/phosphoenolpyruvate mutase family protein [Crenalkalicoccus sp.]|nr:isocitrate lyase/phosphoenolpyruvate mutase family protein [Crenalkalicoccus sp.]
MSEAHERFRALHQQARAFIMPNAWDGASAALLKRAGFEALGTSSIAIAYALGRQDGRHAVSREEAIANGVLLGRISGLPVNGDLEDGYGPAPEDCVATVEAAVAAGFGGLGIEDTTADPAQPIHGFDQAVARIAAAAKAARGRILLTGRTDVLLFPGGTVEEAIRRLTAFAEAGADVLYAPGLPDMPSITAVVRAVAPRPVNVVVGPRSGPVPLAELSAAGVKRVSLGGALYMRAMAELVTAAEALAAGDLAAAASRRVPSGEIGRLLPA